MNEHFLQLVQSVVSNENITQKPMKKQSAKAIEAKLKYLPEQTHSAVT